MLKFDVSRRVAMQLASAGLGGSLIGSGHAVADTAPAGEIWTAEYW